MNFSISSEQSNLNHLAQLIQNITAAQTVLIFLPFETKSENQPDQSSIVLEIKGLSSEQKIDLKHKSKVGTGIIGWVAKTQEKAKISPFQHSSRALGFYPQDTEVKSIIALPIILNQGLSENTNSEKIQEDQISGVLYCDSPELDYFAKESENCLEHSAELVSRIASLEAHAQHEQVDNLDFETFRHCSEKLLLQLGHHSVEIMRIRLSNSKEIEETIGFENFLGLFQKIQRLIQQALPTHYPTLHCPNGETLIVLDNMMSKMYENKIRIIANQLSPENVALDYSITKHSIRNKKLNSIDDLFAALSTNQEAVPNFTQKLKQYF